MTKKKKSGLKNIIQGKWWYEQHSAKSSENILLFLADFCQKLPSTIQKPFINSIDKTGLLFSKILNIFSITSYQTFLIKGKEKKSGHSLSILFRGNIESIQFLLEYFIKDTDVVKIEKNIKLNVSKSKNEHDLELIQSDSFFTGYFQRKGYLVFPENISMRLKVSQSLDTIISQVSSSIVEDLKKAEKMRYVVEITDDYEKFLIFYEQMYKPYATWKHKSKKRIATFASIKHLWLQGAKILLIKKGKEYIFGGIFLKENKKIITHYAGLSTGKFHHLQHGIMAFSYSALINIAKKMKCDRIDFGTAKPFFQDGLLKYKAKWRMNITQTPSYLSDVFGLKINKKSESVKNIFLNNPFIFYHDQSLAVAIIEEKDKKNVEKNEGKTQQRIVKDLPSKFFTIDELYRK